MSPAWPPPTGALTAGGEELLQDGGAFIGEQAAMDFEAMVERLAVGKVNCTA
jgi:hypothetical protein